MPHRCLWGLFVGTDPRLRGHSQGPVPTCVRLKRENLVVFVQITRNENYVRKIYVVMATVSPAANGAVQKGNADRPFLDSVWAMVRGRECKKYDITRVCHFIF